MAERPARPGPAPAERIGVLRGPVLVVGAGLLGTSVGLALTRVGVRVLLEDVSRDHVRTATSLGAGHPWRPGEEPQLVVVCVPPDVLGESLAHWLTTVPGAVVTDVGSIKGRPLADLAARVDGTVLARYVGSHPMAGSERSGPLAASDALFEGRPWAVTPHAYADPAAVVLVEELAEACGATVLRLGPDEHDLAVARTSHLPHLVAALVAGQLAAAPEDHLALSGQGVRDVTRIAAGDPGLWQQIVTSNADAVLDLLGAVAEDLETLIGAVRQGDRDGLGVVLARGVAGARSLPGKHGGRPRPLSAVRVAVPDRPGELARLFADVGEIGTNVEDFRIDHDTGRAYGQAEVMVAEDAVDSLVDGLGARGWTAYA
ncbi:prephenate dehydrogenase [Nocardioidaceae bacterium]|nr:prephenate dehydrogenase [Nocardioidaceae bacterium]